MKLSEPIGIRIPQPVKVKLKEIANEIDVPLGAGLIVRTAGAKRTKTEIKRDYEYLQRLSMLRHANFPFD